MDARRTEEVTPLLNSVPKDSTISLFCTRNQTQSNFSSSAADFTFSNRPLSADQGVFIRYLTIISQQLHNSTVFCCLLYPSFPADSLSVDQLQQMKQQILLQVFSTSDVLVSLLQERHVLVEEVHVRAIAIEQLHNLHRMQGCSLERGLRSFITRRSHSWPSYTPKPFASLWYRFTLLYRVSLTVDDSVQTACSTYWNFPVCLVK